jgi:hypothetical protein
VIIRCNGKPQILPKRSLNWPIIEAVPRAPSIRAGPSATFGHPTEKVACLSSVFPFRFRRADYSASACGTDGLCPAIPRIGENIRGAVAKPGGNR